MKIKIGELCTFAPKSGIKAGEATPEGKYMFFTSSRDENKRFTDFQFDGEGIIMGTGGNATLHYYQGKFAVSTDCIVLMPDERVKCKYLYYFFLANIPILEAGFKGAGLRHTSKKYIGDISIPLIPQIPIQERIIKILDHAQSVLIFREKQLQVLDRLIKARFVEMFGDLKINSKGWVLAGFKECASIDTNMIRNFKGYEDYPHIGIENIQKETGRILDYRTVFEDKVISGKYLFTPGHIIYSKIRPNLNKVALPNFNGLCSADSYPILVKKGICNREFLGYTLRSKYFLDYILAYSDRTNLPKVNKNQVERFILPLPPISLQNTFSDFVTQVDKSKVVVQKALDEAQLLFDSLLQQYFG